MPDREAPDLSVADHEFGDYQPDPACPAPVSERRDNMLARAREYLHERGLQAVADAMRKPPVGKPGDDRIPGELPDADDAHDLLELLNDIYCDACRKRDEAKRVGRHGAVDAYDTIIAWFCDTAHPAAATYRRLAEWPDDWQSPRSGTPSDAELRAQFLGD